MINPNFAITSFEEDFGFEEYLKKVHLFEIFAEIFEQYPTDALGIIKFIAWSYGMDSEMLATAGNSWSKVATQIFERSNLPQALWNDVGLLEGEVVQSAVQKFLRYQNDENWTQFITYRDLRRQMLSSSLASIKKSSGEVDYEQKMANAQHSQKLLEMMNDAKDIFVQNNPKLKSSVEAFNKATEKNKVTRNVGSYAK